MSEEEQAKKLWAVDLSGTLLVLAASANEAEDVARRSLDDAAEVSVDAREVNEYDLGADVLSSYPWGGDGDLTVRQWIAKHG